MTERHGTTAEREPAAPPRAKPSGTAPMPGPGTRSTTRRERLWPYALVGLYLGTVFTRAEVVSWFRIQEMFRFQSVHMYGIIGSAVLVAGVGVALVRRGSTWVGRPMELPREPLRMPGWQYWLGGISFGLGWGLLGACPGPIYVLIGNGVGVMLVALASALTGVWTYAALRHRLPHS
jgi:hypothetical protein